MKKLFAFLFCLAMASLLHAQHCDSINDHFIEGYSLQPEFVIQLADGNLLVRALQDTVISSYQSEPSLVKFYKVSRHGLTILDSVTYNNTEGYDILMARIHDDSNPVYAQYCNLLAQNLIDDENCKTDLKLSFFDDDLVFNDDMEITVALSDTIVPIGGHVGSIMIDSNNDLILQYCIPSRDEVYFERFGLDGTLKHRTIIPRSIMPVLSLLEFSGFQIHGFKQSHEHPAKYILYGVTNQANPALSSFVSYELDSLFNIVNTLTIPPTSSSTYPYIHNIRDRNEMIGLNDGSVMVVRDVRWTDDQQATGIAKYDANGNLLKTVWFDSTDVPTHWAPNGFDDYHGIGLLNDNLGHVFVAFHCVVDSMENVAVIKLDEELNIIWEHYGMHVKQPVIYHRDAYERYGLNLLDHGGAVVFGYNYGRSPQYNFLPYSLFMMLVDDENVGTSETANLFRPYRLFPNPVKDQLHLHYSPDVTPKRVELYDIQGRLISIQSSNLEHINVEQLPTGTYMLHVVMKDGKSYSDKVVKQ